MTHLVFKKGYIGGRQDQTQLIGTVENLDQFKNLIEERENLLPQDDGSLKNEMGRTVHEPGDESFDLGDYWYAWSTVEELSPSELDAIPVGAFHLHPLESSEKREILAKVLENSNEIVHYFGDIATTDTITDIVELFAKIVDDDIHRISDVLGEYNRDWDNAPCNEEGPTDEQDKKMDEIVLSCAKEIAAVAFPEERIVEVQ